MTDEELKRHEMERLQVVDSYKQIKDTDGMSNHLLWLENQASQARRRGDADETDAYSRSLAVQDAKVYEKVVSHLLDMFKDDVTPTT